MARRKNAPESVRIKHGLSDRLRSLRTEFYGDRGGPDLARTLGIPVRTWYNYENGVTVPAEIILRVVELTSVEPVWLLRGDGPKLRNPSGPNSSEANQPRTTEGLANSPITTLLRVALERLEQNERAHDHQAGPSIIPRREKDGGERDSGSGGEASGPDDRPPASGEAGSEEDVRGGWLEGRRAFGNLKVADDSMSPIVAEGANVSYAGPEPVSEDLNDKLVVAWVDGAAVVRWFKHCGRFALLRAENPSAAPPSILVELDRPEGPSDFHRVLWISTPH
jgi:hypothetical protein